MAMIRVSKLLGSGWTVGVTIITEHGKMRYFSKN